MHDAVSVHDHLFAPQLLQRTDRGGVLAGEDGVLDDGMGGGEIEDPVAGIGPRHAQSHIDPAVDQVAIDLVPFVQPDLDAHPHHFSDGLDQVDGETGRLAVRIDEFVGRVAPVSPDQDRLSGVAYHVCLRVQIRQAGPGGAGAENRAAK